MLPVELAFGSNLTNQGGRLNTLDINSLGLQIFHEAILPSLPPGATTLHAAKRRVNIDRGARVDRHHPGLDFLRHPQGPRDIARIDRRGEPERGVVGHLHRFVLGVEGAEREHRPEDLLAVDAGVVFGVQEDGRFDEAAGGAFAGAAGDELGFGFALLDEREDALELEFIGQGPDQRCGCGGVVSDRGRGGGEARFQGGDERGRNGGVD